MLQAIYGFFVNSPRDENEQHDKDLSDAIAKTKHTLESTGQSLRELLIKIESAQNEEDIKSGFDKLNDVMRFLLRVYPGQNDFKSVREAIKIIGISESFEENLVKSCKLEDAIRG